MKHRRELGSVLHISPWFSYTLPVFIFLFIFGFPYLPLQDYPNWLYQGYVFNKFALHGNNFHGYFSLQPNLAPNIITTVAIASLATIVDIFTAGKIFLFITAIGLYSGVIRYSKFFLRQNSSLVPFLALYLVFNLQFLLGYTSYIAGIALAIHTVIFLIEREGKFFLIAGSFMVCYSFHFFSFLTVILFLAIYFLYYKDFRQLKRIASAALPTAAVFLHYLLTRTITLTRAEVDLRSAYNVIRDRFLVLSQGTIPFHHFKWVSTTSQFFIGLDYVFAALLLLVYLLVFFKAVRERRYSFHFCITTILLMLILAMPTYGGGILQPGERFVLFYVVNLAICFLSYYPSRRIAKLSTAAMLFFTIGSFCYTTVNVAKYNSIIEQQAIPSDAISRPNMIREGTNGFLHFHYYQAIREDKAVPCFTTGLLRYPKSELYEIADPNLATDDP